MQKKLTAAFDSVDEAERAIARLRRIIEDYQVEMSGEPVGSLPADTPYAVSGYYPARADLTSEPALGTPSVNGRRILLTSEIMGTPVGSRPTELQLILEESDAERARALLVNQGAQRTRLT